MFDLSWQDLIFSVGNFFFFLALLPSVFSKNKPSFWTCLPTAFFLTTFIVAYTSLDLWASAINVGLAALAWWVLAAQTFVQGQRQVEAAVTDTKSNL